jgi:Flp pilus assembly protein TadB
MWDFLRDVLKKNGLLAIVLLGACYLLYWQMNSAADERKNLFDTQMEYIMDVRVKLAAVEQKCGR